MKEAFAKFKLLVRECWYVQMLIAVAFIALCYWLWIWLWIWLCRQEHPEAWVQAIGSIAAIFASAGLVNWQNHLETKRLRQDEHKNKVGFLNAVSVAAQHTCMASEWAVETSFTNGKRTAAPEYIISDLKDRVELMKSIPIFNSPAPETSGNIVLIIRNAQTILNAQIIQGINGAFIVPMDKEDAELLLGKIKDETARIDDYYAAMAVKGR